VKLKQLYQRGPLGWATMTSKASVSAVNLLIHGGYVLTMDAAGGIPGEAHVRDGVIQSIGRGLDVPEAELADASGMIVAPGLVDAHWHMWNTLLRGMWDGRPGVGAPARPGYFTARTATGGHFLPGDTYTGTRLAAAEAVDAGIATVHDWSHNIRVADWAEAGLRALAESGLRARFSYGCQAGPVGGASRVARGSWPACSAARPPDRLPPRGGPARLRVQRSVAVITTKRDILLTP
jgi:cytosine/adenosine deaminase-related metal-dependent hydrolase